MVSGEDNDGEKVNLFEEMGSSTVIFEECEMRTIVPGYPETINFFFVMDEAATITWTATAYALDNTENDVNWNNNTVEETTIVNKPKGGGGGH
jgi:hypothetical protein